MANGETPSLRCDTRARPCRAEQQTEKKEPHTVGSSQPRSIPIHRRTGRPSFAGRCSRSWAEPRASGLLGLTDLTFPTGRTPTWPNHAWRWELRPMLVGTAGKSKLFVQVNSARTPSLYIFVGILLLCSSSLILQATISFSHPGSLVLRFPYPHQSRLVSAHFQY